MAGIVHEVENTDLLAQVRQESAAAARQLGISRTTLWRYLGKIETREPADPT